jgi:glutamate synthase (NADPH/NADH) small chain
MLYGIPEFRLPKALVQREIETLQAMGVELKTNFIVGRTRKLNDLLTRDGFKMAFVGSGAGLPKFMNIPGENLVNVFSANEYLTRANLMKAYDEERAGTPIARGKRVAVMGGGNVAMDAARMALRLGAVESSIVYRRTAKEMPARIEEVEHAKEEGVNFRMLECPTRFIGDDKGRLKAMECLRFELGEPDDSGRRRPVAIKGSEFMTEIDVAVVAIGNDPNPLIPTTTPEISVSKWGGVIVDEQGKSSLPTVYAGGDIVRGAATVILAMGDARIAARAINAALALK